MNRKHIRGRLIVALIVGLSLIFTGCAGKSSSHGISDNEVTSEISYQGFFDNAKLNKMIDENFKDVENNGWAELRIPSSIHGISEGAFSDNALVTAQKLIDAGYEAYIIGGAVRDLVMGTETMDFDITTNASNQEIKKVFKNAKFHTIPTGLEFAYVDYPGEVIDVAGCVNIPAEYKGLKGVPDFDPAQMYSDSFVSDSFQRDLTINAIYYDVKTGDIVDYHGGLHDIREQILQTMVDAEAAFKADPRISIRAMRFKARYGFDFSDRLDEVLREGVAKYVTEPGPESNSFNIPKFFDAGYALDSYEVLEEYGAFPVLFAPVADICATDDYKKYLTSAMKRMDDWEANGDEFSSDLYMAVILWPQFEGVDKEQIQKKSEEVLSQQSKTIMISDEDMDDFTDLFILEKKFEEDLSFEDSVILVTQNEFEDAYDLLVVRSLTDESLADKVDYWTEMREELLYDEMDIAA